MVGIEELRHEDILDEFIEKLGKTTKGVDHEGLFHKNAVSKLGVELEKLQLPVRTEILSRIADDKRFAAYAPFIAQIYRLEDGSNRRLLTARINAYFELMRTNKITGVSNIGPNNKEIIAAGQEIVELYEKAARAEGKAAEENGELHALRVRIDTNRAAALDRQQKINEGIPVEDVIEQASTALQRAKLQLAEMEKDRDDAVKNEVEYPQVLQYKHNRQAAEGRLAQATHTLEAAQHALRVAKASAPEQATILGHRVTSSGNQAQESTIRLDQLRKKIAQESSEDGKARIQVQIDSEITALDRSKTALEIAKLQLEKLRQGPVGPTPEQREKISLQIKQARLSLKASTDQYNEWANDNQVAARDLGAQVQIAEARKILENIQEQSAGKKDIRATFQDVMGRWQEVIANIDPNDPDSWGQKDEATAGLVQGLMSAGGKTIATWEDAMALLGPLQSTLDRIESRERADERLRIEAEERARRIKLEDEAREAEKERIRKEEESLRLQEEGLGRTVESMTSMFAPGAVEVAPAPISAAPPPPPAAPPPAAAPVEGVASDEDVSAEVNKLLGISGGGGNPPIGIQEVLDKYNGTGGGDPYHESEELDLDGSDNDAEEVIIEEISFMPPHPIKKFAPPVASGAPPVIINIGTGGFTPPII